jgi:hypothetical protein
MGKLLEILSKLGILKYGSTAGIYKNEAAPTDFEYMNKSGKEQGHAKDKDEASKENNQETAIVSNGTGTPLWMIVTSWVVGALFWLIALGAFAEGKGLIGFWMTLAGLVTVPHTNQLLSLIGIDLTPLWRVVVVLVCMLVFVVSV